MHRSILREIYRPDGYNLGMNLGECAGAGVAGHIHMHVLPRWTGDANFLSTIGETRVLPEELAVTWRKLSEAFAGILERNTALVNTLRAAPVRKRLGELLQSGAAILKPARTCGLWSGRSAQLACGPVQGWREGSGGMHRWWSPRPEACLAPHCSHSVAACSVAGSSGARFSTVANHANMAHKRGRMLGPP